MSQSAIRESTISRAGSATSTASRTDSVVMASSDDGATSRASTKATSASTRGCTRVRIEIGSSALTSMSLSR